MTFDWNLQSDAESGVSAQNVLRILKFSESLYIAPPYIKALEDQGKRGDRILMRGLHTGAAVITLKPSDPVYKNIPESRVRMVVVANLQLSPSVAYIMQHATVTYTVHLMKQSQAYEVTMPSQEYYIEVDNKAVALFDVATSTACGTEFGSTEVKLKSPNAYLSGTFREPSAGLYVVAPGYLEFTVLPGRSWMLETSRTYNIQIEIFDKESHKIYPSDNIRVKAEFPQKYFQVISSSQNGTYHVVKTLHKGFTTLIGELQTVLLKDGQEFLFTPPIEGQQNVEIFDPIELLPKILVLPWDPEGNSVNYQLLVSGGSGNYTWQSSNTSIARVNPHGVVITSGLIGSTVVAALDVRNAAHFDTAQVFVIPPSRIEFTESVVEAEVGTILQLPLALFGRLDDREVKFDDCHSISFNVILSDPAIFKYITVAEPTVPGSCASVSLEARVMGHIDVSVVYKHDNVLLRTSITIAAYRPLKAIDPVDIAVVTLGASKEVVFEGGPQPWVLDASRYVQTASVVNQNNVEIGKVATREASGYTHSFHVKCLGLGEEVLTLTVGNEPTMKNKFPVVVIASVRLACEEPKGLRLMPVVVYPESLPPCPISAEFDDPVPVPLTDSVSLAVTVTDRLGRKFDNFSSLVIDWTTSEESLGSFQLDRHGKVAVSDITDGHFSRFTTLLLKDTAGRLSVTATISRYDQSYVQSWTAPTLNPSVTRTRVLDIVHYPSLTHKHLSIYNHPQNKVLLHIRDGSGYFHLECDQLTTHVANVTYSVTQPRDVTIVPVVEGSLSVIVTDLCLYPLHQATSTVVVSDIGSIVIEVVDKVEINQEVNASVQVLDYRGRSISRDHFNLMGLRLAAGSDILSVRKSGDQNAGDKFTAVYIVRGLSLGRTDIMATAVQQHDKKKVISSGARKIQVFPPLKLEPQNITVVVGSIFQVIASGGPQPESAIEFSIDNHKIGSINQSGLIEALVVGRTIITARAVGQGAQSRSVVYSQDSATLNVVELTGIRIRAPLKRLRADTQMPLYVVGIGDSLEPFSFAGVIPPLQFVWSVSNKQVAQLESSFYKSGIKTGENGSLAARLLAINAGHVTVSVEVTSVGRTKDSFRDSITIQVFERLHLTSPFVPDGEILVTPNTQFEVKTNRDGSSAKISYSVKDCGDSKRDNQELPVTVNAAGLLTSAAFTGQACLLITSHEDFAINQSIAVLVKVKPLSYIMINADTKLHSLPGSKVTAFPTAMTVDFSVSFHDDFGVEFYATHSKIRFRLNKYDSLQMSYGHSNNTLIGRPTNPGLTVLKVWEDSNTAIPDYVGIEVGHAIQPSSADVALGSVICFTCPLTSNEGHTGDWMGNNAAVTVDRETGISVAVQVGTSMITYNVSSTVATQTEVRVVPVTKISLLADNIPHLTNVPPSKGRTYPTGIAVVMESVSLGQTTRLVGSDCSETVRTRSKSHWAGHVPFRCDAWLSQSHQQLNLNDILQITATFDPSSGKYQCSVMSTASEDNLQLVSTINADIHVRAVVAETVGQPETLSEVARFNFVPAFYILTTELHVSNMQPVAHLKLSANDRVLKDLMVISTDTSLIVIRERLAVGPLTSDRVIQFPVELQVAVMLWKGAPPVINVEVKCMLTGQTQTVPVRIIKGQHAELSWAQIAVAIVYSHYNLLMVFLTVVATVLCCVLAYQWLFTTRRAGAPPPMASSPFLSPPTRQSPAAIQQSPWTSVYANDSTNDRLWSVDRSPYVSPTLRRSPAGLMQ